MSVAKKLEWSWQKVGGRVTVIKSTSSQILCHDPSEVGCYVKALSGSTFRLSWRRHKGA